MPGSPSTNTRENSPASDDARTSPSAASSARRPWEQVGHVVLTKDRGLEGAGLDIWLQSEFTHEQRAKTAIGLERFVCPAHRVQGEHFGPVGTLAESIQPDDSLSVGQTGAKVAGDQGGLGRL